MIYIFYFGFNLFIGFFLFEGMPTTQRSESINKFFKDFLNFSTPMSKFMVQYHKAVKARYDKEKEKNFKTKNTKAILETLYRMEDETSKGYTRKVFRMLSRPIF